MYLPDRGSGLHISDNGQLRYPKVYSALVNRQPVVKHPQVLSEYFQHGQWQVFLI